MAEKPKIPPGPSRSSAASSLRCRVFQMSTDPAITTKTSMLGTVNASRITSPGAKCSMRAPLRHLQPHRARQAVEGCDAAQDLGERGDVRRCRSSVVPSVSVCCPALTGPVGHSGGARRGRIRDRIARGPDGGVQRLRPRSVVDVLLEGGVDLVDHLRVALLDPDAVQLIGETLADDLQLAAILILGRESGEDHVVGGHRVHLAVVECRDAVGERRQLDQLDLIPGTSP